MSGRSAIRAVGLTKDYPIVIGREALHGADGAPVASYRTLRESITNGLRRLVHGGPPGRTRELFAALCDVSFEVETGAAVGIIGRNGAGKTTLLKILSRITEPTQGYAEVHGRVGTLLEVGTGFHAELTGRENIFLSGAILGMKRREIQQRFKEIVDFAEVERFLDVPLKRFSSGMYLRLAFAVAAHLETEIMLVDEVLAVGDLEFRRRCLGKMRDVGRSGRTVLYVSHDMNSVRQLCDRVMWLDRGRIVRQGPTAAMVAEYEANAYSETATADGVFRRPAAEHRAQAIWFEEVQLRDTSDAVRTTFEWGEKLRLVMKLAGRAPADGYSIEWSINNERGERVAWGAANPQQDVYFDRQDEIVECEIGPLWLTSGTYRIWLSVILWNQMRWDVWDDAATFRIALADPFRSGFDSRSMEHGAILMPHRWRVLQRRDQG